MQGEKNLTLGSSYDEYKLAKTLTQKGAEWVSEAEGHCGYSEVIQE